MGFKSSQGASEPDNLVAQDTITIKGTTPKFTIGDGGAEDTMLVFDGNAQDYRIGLDDGTDKLEIGVGAAHGTTTALTIDSSQVVAFSANVLLPDGKNIVFGDGSDFTLGYNSNYANPVFDAKAGTFWIISSGETANKPEIRLASGNNGSSGGHIVFSKSRGWDPGAYDEGADRIVADDDALGSITWEGSDGGDPFDETTPDSDSYASIHAESSDVSSGAECGKLDFKVLNNGSSQSILTLGGRDVENGPNYSAVTLASDTALIGARPSATVYSGNDGSIPITGVTANVDGNGARTGLRFAGVGVAGQLLVVQNTGGENLTFHGTEGTALLKGVAAANDTMLPGGTYMFVSDGSLWVLIGGGAATNAVGLAAG